ncbi:MAG: DUF6077 domain-containing protein [Candidatus Binatia bacterium]
MDKPAERSLLRLLEFFLTIVASGTLAYHCALALRLPAYLLVVPWGLVFVLFSAHACSHWITAARTLRTDYCFPLVAILLGSIIGLFTLLTARPDGDDIQLFHRYLLQLHHLERPFPTTEPLYANAHPPLDFIGRLPAYEAITVLSAYVLGIDPLHAIHNLVPFLCSVLWVLTQVLLYRWLGLSRSSALLATTAAFLFLLCDGNQHRSFGNMTFVRLWQGKVILWTLCVPLTLLFAFRYLEKPTRQRWMQVFLATIAAQGLSATGLFLVPALLVAVSLAALLQGCSTRQGLVAVALSATSIYSALLLAFMASGALPNYDLSGLYSTWPNSWAANVGLVIHSEREWVRNALLLFLLPVFSLSPDAARQLIVLSLNLAVLYFNPWTGVFLLSWVTPGAYWRFVYLFPLPLCAGLLVECFRQVLSSSTHRWGRLGIATIVAASIVWAYQQSVLAGLSWKKPTAYRFPPTAYAFAAAILNRVHDRKVLAPESIIFVLPLLTPDVTIESARPFQTMRDFAKLGRPHEGTRRAAAQALVTTCRFSLSANAALVQSLQNGVDAVVVGPCPDSGVAHLAEILQSHGRWVESERQHGYVLFLLTSPLSQASPREPLSR